MPETIRLLKVTHNYPRWTGDYAGPFVSLLAGKLPKHGITPVVLAPHHKGAQEAEEMNGVKVYRFRYAAKDDDENLAYHGEMHKLVLGSVNGIFRFRKFLNCFRHAAEALIEREKIDALAGHWLVPSGMVMKSVNKGRNLPAFMYSHGTDIRLMNKYRGVAYRYLKDFCLGLRGWTVVSSHLKEQMLAIDGRLADVIDVLPLPQDETVFHPDATVAKDDNLIVAVARLTEQKRVDVLLKAFAMVTEKLSEVKLEIYGGGPLLARMVGLMERLKIQSRVKIFEPIPQAELRTVYNRAAMVVLNSVQEGFGLALSEAMLCRTAVIGARSGGITDIIEHEKRGLLVEPDNPEALADAIFRFLNDKFFRERMAGAGLQFALAEYASEALAARYADIIRQGVARRI